MRSPANTARLLFHARLEVMACRTGVSAALGVALRCTTMITRRHKSTAFRIQGRVLMSLVKAWQGQRLMPNLLPPAGKVSAPGCQRKCASMEKAYKPCHVASCGNLTQERYCSQHEYLMSSRSRRASIEWHDWYRSTRYRAARFKFMARHPWCATPGCGHVATTLDHIVPHRGNR